MSSFEQDMQEHAQAFDNATASEFGSDLPDGQYVVAIQKAEVKRSKNGQGRWQLSWDAVVLWDPQGSKFKNRHIFFHDGITKFDEQTGKHSLNDTGIGIMKKRFVLMGFGQVKHDQVGQLSQQTIGRVVALTQKTNGDFVNVYFDGQLADNIASFTPPANASDLKARIAQAKKPAPTGPVTLPGVAAQPQQAVPAAPPLQFEE